MVRDWEIIRAILVAAESIGPTAQLRVSDVEGDPAVVAAHMEMLHDAGFIEAKILRTNSGMAAFVSKVTFSSGPPGLVDGIDSSLARFTWVG